jgi:hypothetical protein
MGNEMTKPRRWLSWENRSENMPVQLLMLWLFIGQQVAGGGILHLFDKDVADGSAVQQQINGFLKQKFFDFW